MYISENDKFSNSPSLTILTSPSIIWDLRQIIYFELNYLGLIIYYLYDKEAASNEYNGSPTKLEQNWLLYCMKYWTYSFWHKLLI